MCVKFLVAEKKQGRRMLALAVKSKSESFFSNWLRV